MKSSMPKMRHTEKQGSVQMKRLAILAAMMLVTSCGTGRVTISEAGACDALAALVDAHADALLLDAGQASVTTGANLIAAYDAACP